MAEAVLEGSVYKIDLQNGVPAHYWIVLHTPNLEGRFVMVSLTDRNHDKSVPDVWPTDYPLCANFKLVKNSINPNYKTTR